jgi:subtilisin
MQIVQNIPNETMDYGIRLINACEEWNETRGEGINIAILDTGIDYTHVDLKDCVKGGVNFTTEDRSDYMDRCGHGTFCSGIIAAAENGTGLIGIAPNSNLYAVKVLNDKGQGSINWLIQGVNWCIENNIDIISMSLGFTQDTPEMRNIISKAYDKGIIMIAAVGNDNRETEVEYPARYPEVIGVTAVDNCDELGNFCTTGSKVEVSAPGVNITSTYLNNLYAIGSGTSFAAPHITGAIALIQSGSLKHFKQKLNFIEVKAFLDMHVQDLGEPGKDNKYGYGLFHF